jgi:sigma-B regulation protein RsbU (phosphoserine phosphatase)
VDDSPPIRDLFALLLESAGYRTTRADSGLAALLSVKELGAPDAIILDFMMPGLSGPDTLRVLRATASTRDVPVIFVTSSGEEESIEEGLGAGATDYITKPVDRRILVKRVAAAIDSQKAAREAARVHDLERERSSIQLELRSAQALQMSLVPDGPARWAQCSASGTLAPCGEVGGDLFDVVDGRDGAKVLVLLDVSGHGLASAMVAASVRSMVRLLLPRLPVQEVMAAVNQELDGSADGHYVCLALVEVSERELHIVNAGLPPVMVHAQGAFTHQVSGAGVPPGLLPGSVYEVTVVPRVPGQRVVMLSDGVTDGLGLGEDSAAAWNRLGLLPTEAGPAALGPDKICAPLALQSAIEAAFPSAAESRADDVTILVFDDLRTAERSNEDQAA